jgi:hypothetical protein
MTELVYGFISHITEAQRNAYDKNAALLSLEHTTDLAIADDSCSQQTCELLDAYSKTGRKSVLVVKDFHTLTNNFRAAMSPHVDRVSFGYATSYEVNQPEKPVELFTRLKVVEQARKWFKYYCPINTLTLVHDFKGDWALRNEIVRTQTPCFCFGGYQLAAYVFSIQNSLPFMDRSFLTGLRLHADFGLTVERLREYLQPMQMIAGAGGQMGLDTGMRWCLAELGFGGVMVSPPFNLGSLEKPLYIHKEPTGFPVYVGYTDGRPVKNNTTPPIMAGIADLDTQEPAPNKLASAIGCITEGKQGHPRQPRLIVATVCRCSPRYTPDVVRWFRRQLAAKLRTPHTFVCLSDKPDEVPGGIALKHNWPGWWAKLELFRPDLFQEGDLVLYFDMDTVLTDTFEVPPIPPKGDLGMVGFGGSWWTHYGSGVMCWRAPLTAPYETFLRRPKEAMAWFPSDQEVVMPAIYNAGGHIIKVQGAEVQALNGTQGIPNDKPKGPIWCAAGSGPKPWETERSWIPPVKVPDVQKDTALVACWFGSEPGLRYDAALKGVARLQKLLPAPFASVLVEASRTGGNSKPMFKWHGEHLLPIVTPSNMGIWQKEVLWNMGARHLLTKFPSVTKLVFVDLDTYPVAGEEDWLMVTSEALDRSELLHPWTVVSEDSGNGKWMSYSAQVAIGMRECCTGQGFAIAMTADWFRRCGGWPELAVGGSGDATAAMQWDEYCSHGPLYKWFPELARVTNAYKGPKTHYGYCAGEMVHAWHGDRIGKDQTRDYIVHHSIWDLCGPIEDVLFKDSNGLWAWNSTPKAQAARDVAIQNLKTRPALLAAWKEACKRRWVKDVPFPEQ